MSNPFNEVLIFKGLADEYWEKIQQLERENAALREDKERLETALRFYADKSHLYETRGAFVENDEHRYCPDGAIVEHGAVARAAIDAARKEQP